MRTALRTGIGVAAGAVTMLLLDDRVRDALGAVTRVVRRPPVPGSALATAVQQKLEHVTPHGRAVSVSADHGCIVLTGDVLTDERALLVREVAAMDGVDAVVDLLTEHRAPDGIPALCASGPALATVPPVDAGERRIAPRVARATAVGAGVGLALAGVSMRGARGASFGVAGALLVAAGLAGTAGAGALADVARIRRIVSLEAAVVVAAPVEHVFASMRSLENMPDVIRHVALVERRGPRRYRWRLVESLGRRLAWDVELTDLRINRRLAWRSVGGARVRMLGVVRFERMAHDRTRVFVQLSYALPFGRDGRAVRALFGSDPDVQLAEDLQHLARSWASPLGARSGPS